MPGDAHSRTDLTYRISLLEAQLAMAQSDLLVARAENERLKQSVINAQQRLAALQEAFAASEPLSPDPKQ